MLTGKSPFKGGVVFYRGFSHFAVWLLLALFMVTTGGVNAEAGDYLFDLPQLEGSYLGDDTLALPPLSVSADLGLQFAEINQASLLIGGTLTTGSYSIIEQEGLYPLTAGVLAWFDGPDNYSDVRLEKYLPPQDGEFEIQDTFGVGPFGTGPDFSPWLDGTAEFEFVVAPPLMIGITLTESMPAVTITSAKLWIEGQPDLDSFTIGPDFDVDGDVDSVDLAHWQAAYQLDPSADADGDGDTDGFDFLAWQRSFGNNFLAVDVEIPEPAAFLLFSLGSGGFLLCRRSTM